MDEDDFTALIEVLTRELEAIGEADIADEHHYVRANADAPGQPELLAPQDHLVAMLEAFERFLSVQDRTTYEHSLGQLNQFITDGGISEVYVDQLGAGLEVNPVRLSDAPNLASVRHDVLHLVQIIRESGGERPRSGP